MVINLMSGVLHLQLERKKVSGVSRLHLHNAYDNYFDFLHFILSLIQLYIIDRSVCILNI